MCSPDPPPAPDYLGAANAQGQANLEAARATAKLSNPNMITPYGTQTVTYGGGAPVLDAGAFNKAMADYQTALARYNAGGGTGTGLFDGIIGAQGSGAPPVRPNPSDYMMTSGDPDIPTVTQTLSPEQQALYNKSVQTKGLLGDLGIQGARSLQGTVGTQLDLSGLPAAPGGASATRAKVFDAMMSRVNEDTANTRQQTNSDLIAAGIRPGTKAYDDRMNLVQRGYNDARQQALLTSGQEASRDFGLDTQARQNAMAELLTARQTPLNEISALMSGSQVSNPFAGQGYQAGATVKPGDIMGATGLMGQYNTGLYNAQAAQYNNNLSTAGAALPAALTALQYFLPFSDRRLKRDIRRIGTHPLGIGLYAWTYIWGEPSVGVMADEVREVRPDAVLSMCGYDMVNYAALGA